ncbi:hypothetical protein LguiA_018907 [Lonicera macranthoides]
MLLLPRTRMTSRSSTSTVNVSMKPKTSLSGSAFAKSLYTDHQIASGKIRFVSVHCLSSRIGRKASKMYEYEDNSSFVKRREVIGLLLVFRASL